MFISFGRSLECYLYETKVNKLNATCKQLMKEGNDDFTIERYRKREIISLKEEMQTALSNIPMKFFGIIKQNKKDVNGIKKLMKKNVDKDKCMKLIQILVNNLLSNLGICDRELDPLVFNNKTSFIDYKRAYLFTDEIKTKIIEYLDNRYNKDFDIFQCIIDIAESKKSLLDVCAELANENKTTLKQEVYAYYCQYYNDMSQQTMSVIESILNEENLPRKFNYDYYVDNDTIFL
jgi:hypothetical protein